MRSTRYLPALLAILVGAACEKLNVPDSNAPSLNDLEKAPTRSGVATAVQGLIRGVRGTTTGATAGFGAFGREGYNLDPSNPQNPANLYVRLDQNVAIWAGPYGDLRQGKVILKAVDLVSDLSAEEKEGIRGFVKTMEALDLLYLIMGTDQNGGVTDVNENTNDPLPAPATKAQMYSQIFQLLDESRTHLQAAGNTFAFGFPSGFAGFTTPSSFLTVNRAIRARADIYNKDFTRALTDLAASFLDTNAPLTLGVYHNYSENSGDVTNPLFDPTTRQRFAHPSIRAQAQLKADGTLDNRALTKTAPITPLNRFGFSLSEKLTVYTSTSAPVPIIRNEELILLRAEANLGIGTVASITAARSDINFIRQNAGGLDPIGGGTWTAMSLAQQLDELLYNKRYSLFWEFGTSWIDARNYVRLAQLPHDRPGDLVFPHHPWPESECSQRSPRPSGCTVPAGL